MGVLKAKVGGTWTEIGAVGTDEVNIGPTTPVDAAVELWYDTAAVPAVDPAKMPRGYIALANQSVVQTTIGVATVDITGCSVTWVADPTRRYKTIAFMMLRSSVANEQYSEINNGSAALRGAAATAITNGVYVHAYSHIESGLSGSQTRKLRAASSAGTLSTGANQYASFILVEDIGGV